MRRESHSSRVLMFTASSHDNGNQIFGGSNFNDLHHACIRHQLFADRAEYDCRRCSTCFENMMQINFSAAFSASEAGE